MPEIKVGILSYDKESLLSMPKRNSVTAQIIDSI